MPSAVRGAILHMIFVYFHYNNTHFVMPTAVKVTLILTGGFLTLIFLFSIKDNVFYFRYRQQEDFDG